mmetsp:Transcript_14503/g.29667  ORF Transcript_14503/g.29667 Transcript_14503/m.29667 type:complete len:508 (-) Transcript_14503:21-1544(-)
MEAHQQQHGGGGGGTTDAPTSNDVEPLVSLQIIHNNEGELEVEGVLSAREFDTTSVVEHLADNGSIDKDVADFISELETDSPVDIQLSPVERAHEEELDAIKENLDDTFSNFTEKEEFDCDYSASTECHSTHTEKICNLTSEELRHGDASYTPSSGLTLRKYAKPDISNDEVLIRVYATTISTRDCLERIRRDNNEGLLYDAWVPGHEIVGRVEQAGSNAQHLLHRRVAALLSHGGGCSRYLCVHSKDLITLPENAFPTSNQDMVHLLSTYMTAYQCLDRALPDIDQTFCGATDLMGLDSDDFGPRSPLSESCVLINGAGSTVGLALVELAKNAGATVYAVSHSSHEKDIREIGVKEWYPLFRRQEWRAEWSGKMNLIVDTVGDYDNYPIFYEVMAPRGRFVRMNTTSCGKKYVPVLGEQVKVFSALKDYKGSRINNTAIDYNVFYSFNDDQELFTEDLAYLYHLLQMGKIEPRVFSKVGFDELQEEWEKVMGGGANGVVVVLPWKD